MTTRALLASVAVLLTFALVSCGGDDGEDTSPATREAETTAPEPSGSEPAPSGEAARAEKVEIAEFAYEPDPVTIQVGGKVNWINRDSAPHTATAEDGSFDTGTIEEGKLKGETFKQPGTYRYICSIHPTMKGTVEVVEK